MAYSSSKSRSKKVSRRQVFSLAGGATLALGTLGVMTFGAAGTAFAQSTAGQTSLSTSVTIGSPTVSPASPTVQPSSAQVGTSEQFGFTVTAPAAIAKNGSIDWTLPSKFTETAYAVYDQTTGALLVSGATSVATGAVASAVSSGDQIEFVITGYDSVASSTDVFTGDGVATASVDFTIPTQLTLTPSTDPTQPTEMSFTFLKGTALAANGSTSTYSATVTADAPSLANATFNTADATLSVNGSAQTITGSTSTSAGVKVAYDSSTDTFTITNEDTSATVPSGEYVLTVPVTGLGAGTLSATYTSTAYSTETSSAVFGLPEIVSGVSASNPYAGQSSTVTVDFTNTESATTPTPLTVAGLGLSSQSTSVSAKLVDNTTGAQQFGFFGGADGNTSGSGFTLASNDSYTLTLTGVTLPSSSTTVELSTGYANAGSADLTIGSLASSGLVVSASTSNVLSSSLWSFGNIEATSTLASGSTLALTIASGSTGAYFPAVSGDYQITDLTNTADSQTPTFSVTTSNGVETATLTLTKSIASGDVIAVTVSGVYNPATSADYTATVTSNSADIMAGLVSAPSAASTQGMANGAIANDAGALYEWAGGYAFHLPNVTDAGVIEKMAGSPSQQTVGVPSSSIFTSGDSLAMGTLVQGVQSGTVLAPIYVVNSSGDLVHITNPATFMSNGYSPRDVVEIPQRYVSMMTMAGSGTAVPMASAVQANGSFWQASGGSSIYEWVGGVAVHVQNPTDLVAVNKYMGEQLMAHWSQVSTSAVSSSELVPSVPQMGTVVKVLDGSAAGSYYVSTGTGFVSVTSSDLASLGYPMADILEISALNGIPVVS
ncbi:MAG: beta strand repeat-containing protein [Ferrimicrobium acidiphilum]